MNTILVYLPIVSGQASNRLAPVLNPALDPTRYKSQPHFPGLAPSSHPTQLTQETSFSNSSTEAHITKDTRTRLTLRRPRKQEALG